MNVLVIDEDELSARATARQLHGRHEVRVVFSLSAARDAIADERPEVLLYDLDYDGDDADRFLDELHADDGAIRVVLHTSADAERWMPLVERGLVHAALIKPARLQHLLQALAP